MIAGISTAIYVVFAMIPLKGIIARVTVRSHNFRVISRGILEDSRAVAQIEAIIERADEKATVRYWKQMH